MVPKLKKYILIWWQNCKILTIVQGPWNWGGLTWWTLFFGTYSIVAWQALSLSLYGTRVHWPQENGLGHLLALLGNVTKNPREKPNICPTLVAMHNSIWLTSLLTYRLYRRPTLESRINVGVRLIIVEKNWRKKNRKWTQCTEVHFASFLSGWFITAIVVNSPEKKLLKHTSVH